MIRPEDLLAKAWEWKIVRYGGIGTVATLLHLSTASLYLWSMTEASVFVANTTGFLVAFVFSYVMQSKYVFGHSIAFVKLLKYFTVQFAALLAAFYLSSMLAGSGGYLRTLFIVVILPLITYVIHTVWTFRGKK